MARWDDLLRAIHAKDDEGAEPIWLELLESDLDHVPSFLDAAGKIAVRQGGKRQASLLLMMLLEALKQNGRDRDAVRVCTRLAALAPDDGSVREELIEAARRAHADRVDLDDLLEKSGVVGGAGPEFAEQAARLESYLQLEPGVFVFHKTGWGVGEVKSYLAERGRCVIDFRSKPGHEMDIDAAAQHLERLEKDDIRAQAMSDPKGLRKRASEHPLEMIRQVLARFDGSAHLRHVKDALVPDAVATSRWSTWWKEAKRRALLDPRFHVGSGRDPRMEYFGSGSADFSTQVERTLAACATVLERQKAARDLLTAAAGDQDAKEVMAEVLRREVGRNERPSIRMGWELLLADVEGREPREVLAGVMRDTQNPKGLLAALTDASLRDAAARVLTEVREDGAATLYEAALEGDDPVLAAAGVDRFAAAGHPEYVARLLDQIDSKPATTPNLYAWYVHQLRRKGWDGREYDAYATTVRVLKVLDAVEYRARRTGTAGDKKGVQALADVLAASQGQMLKDAAEVTDRAGARHLVRVLEQNRGLKARQLQKSTDIILRTHPSVLKDEVEPSETDESARLDRIYMTAEGMIRLRAERDRIEGEEMPANREEIARAREFGDLSENAEYHAAREKQSLLQAKVDAMNGELARAVELTPDVVRSDAVSVGARVRLRDADGEERTYVLLGPPDVDVANGIINYLTPLGQALMGKAVGEEVEVGAGEDLRRLEVLSIENSLA